ncbi:unnamed protein product [Pedinophyceae sp. YPF-701]|nr:unnamed protein product [Pedinophyceae sp. YPF-701]
MSPTALCTGAVGYTGRPTLRWRAAPRSRFEAARSPAETSCRARRRRREARHVVRVSGAAAVDPAGIAGPELGTSELVEVASHTISELGAMAVGCAVLVGSCVRSVPQIVKIIRSKSVEGISVAAVAFELMAYTITTCYNASKGYNFTTYGDATFAGLQDLVLIGLFVLYGGLNGRRAAVATCSLAAAAWWLASGACPPEVLSALQACTIPMLALGGRVPQIVLNFRRGNSGELSGATCALNLAGNVARVFTTAVLTQDRLMLVAAATQGVLNLTLLLQCYGTAKREQEDAQLTATAVGGALA